jgi:hypothetical protein
MRVDSNPRGTSQFHGRSEWRGRIGHRILSRRPWRSTQRTHAGQFPACCQDCPDLPAPRSRASLQQQAQRKGLPLRRTDPPRAAGLARGGESAFRSMPSWHSYLYSDTGEAPGRGDGQAAGRRAREFEVPDEFDVLRLDGEIRPGGALTTRSSVGPAGECAHSKLIP